MSMKTEKYTQNIVFKRQRLIYRFKCFFVQKVKVKNDFIIAWIKLCAVQNIELEFVCTIIFHIAHLKNTIMMTHWIIMPEAV